MIIGCCDGIFRFDYTGKSPIEFKGRSVKKVPVIGAGKCDALFMWWDLEMDTENKILLSCAPRWAHPTPKDMQVLLKQHSHTLAITKSCACWVMESYAIIEGMSWIPHWKQQLCES